MKKLMLVSLLSCLVVGQVFCESKSNYSDALVEGMVCGGAVGTLPVVFFAAAGSLLGSLLADHNIEVFSVRSGLLSGVLFGGICGIYLGLSPRLSDQNVTQAQKEREKYLMGGYLLGAMLGSSLTMAYLIKS